LELKTKQLASVYLR